MQLSEIICHILWCKKLALIHLHKYSGWQPPWFSDYKKNRMVEVSSSSYNIPQRPLALEFLDLVFPCSLQIICSSARRPSSAFPCLLSRYLLQQRLGLSIALYSSQMTNPVSFKRRSLLQSLQYLIVFIVGVGFYAPYFITGNIFLGI